MRTILLVATLLLAGCLQPIYWTKPGITSAEYEQDELFCSYEADKAGGYDPNPFIAGANRSSIFKKCMQVRGYRRM